MQLFQFEYLISCLFKFQQISKTVGISTYKVAYSLQITINIMCILTFSTTAKFIFAYKTIDVLRKHRGTYILIKAFIFYIRKEIGPIVI